MPTGYTYGVVEGKTKTFKEFATDCMRAFGACVHMRDDDGDVPYRKREPSDYHTNEIEKANQMIKEAQDLSDDEIIAKEKERLESGIPYHTEQIEKAKIGELRLVAMLEDVRKWIPPTDEHKPFKNFMIEQIESTIKHDSDTSYHDKELAAITEKLVSLNADSVREQMRKVAYKNLEYHTKEYNADVKRCDDSNKWVSDLIDSIYNPH